ncbi:MAG TPA: CBS domain-containing protein [Candidatus Acidoferrales bacterium]|nr:CBS domain-containing protein [Candidatus Acidoferrales bacterium]
MKVQDVMMRTPVFCSPETNLGAAVEILWNRNCGILPLVDAEQKVVGVVTDRDLCVALGTRNLPPGEINARDVAKGNVYSCGPDDDIHAALETMAKQKVRRLVVLNKQGALEGILSLDDVVLHAEAGSAGRTAELSAAEIVDTERRVYGPQLPQLVTHATAV